MRVQRIGFLIVAIAFLLFITGAGLFAGTTGKIAGRVIDKETSEGLPGANVIIKGTTMGASADINGNFFILNVPAGLYTVEASMMGYTSMEIRSIRVSIDLTTQANFDLASTVLELGEIVSIVAERPLIQKDVTASTQITTDEQIQALPVRTVNEAITAAAGTQGEGNNLHVRGGRAGEVSYLVDGLSVEDPQARTIGLTVGRSALSELQIISGGFNAEYGNAQSGVILQTTREGSKTDYSGSVFYQTDHMGDDGLGESTERFDWYEATLNGPEPITTHLLPKLGLTVPGYLTFFLQGETRTNDGIGWHEKAMAESGEPKFLGTSNSLRNESIWGMIGLSDNRERVYNNWSTKLVWQLSPSAKLTFGWRGNYDNMNNWDFAMGLDIEDVVKRAHAMGISDNLDNDGDGRIDEEEFNSRDDDGDGRIDEDCVLDSRSIAGIATRYEYAWYIDNDNDGRIDEEAYNGIDDDGDGRIDEDLQPYEWNAYDRFVRTEDRANQLILTWSHTLSAKTFYEVRIGKFSTTRRTIPKIGKDGVSRSDFDEMEAWIAKYNRAQAEIDRARSAGEIVPNIEDMIEPYRGFGYPSESYEDVNDNDRYDAGEPFTDLDGDGMWDFNFGNRNNPTWNFLGENHPFRGQRFNGAYWTTFGGGRSGFAKRVSDTYFLKFDITSQVTNNHQIKTGLEANYFDLGNISRQILTPFDGRGLFPNTYHVFPNWQAGYLQDKMEFKSAIINLGFRFERFDQGEQVAEADTSNPGIARFEAPKDKWSLLPRVGFSFPVTENDMFFFNYGQFFQRPQLTNVFSQVNQVFGSSNSIIGNPNLDPETTTSYEFGIRHQFGLNTLFTFTGFFKDIDNLMQINKEFDEIGNTFYTYFNDTYGTVKGLEIQVTQRAGKFFSGSASYTFQVAKATHSTARRTYGTEGIFAQLPGVEYPADWDQRHKIVLNLDYHYGEAAGPRLGNIFPLENFNLSLLANLGSGLPYTPEAFNGSPQFEQTNTERYPWTYDVNLRVRRFFNIARGMRTGLVFEVQNLLNYRNAISPDAGGIVDEYRNRIGFDNSSNPAGTRNYGGYANAVPDPSAWDDGRKVLLGVTIEY